MKILSFEITNSINTDFTKRAGKVLYMMKLNNKNAWWIDFVWLRFYNEKCIVDCKDKIV